MRYRLFGRSGLRVSELFLGTMTFGDPSVGRMPREECVRVLGTYAESGGNVLDTSSAYGDSESVLGGLLEGRRDSFVLASKYAITRDGGDPNAAGGHRKNLTLTLETSLRRLRTDYLDVYWVHIWDRHTPVQETMRALDDAVRAGKILYVGVCNAPAWRVSHANTLAEWRGWTPFAGLQVPYNLLTRDIERDLLPMAEAFGITVGAWSSLARGVLSGTSPGSLSTRQRMAVRAVHDAAADVGATPAQVAIAWTRARSPIVHPIIGVDDVQQLEEDLGATEVVLPGEVVERLDAAVEFDVGFPANHITRETEPLVFGEAAARLDARP